MKVRTFAISAVILVIVTGIALAAMSPQQSDDPLAFPVDYRTWIHTHITVNENQQDPRFGFHDAYVNLTGLHASMFRTTYPDGSKIIMAFYDIDKSESGISQGKLLKYTLMSKDSNRFAETGGWGFATFGPDRMRRPIDMAKDCFGCHKPNKATDYVKSGFVE